MAVKIKQQLIKKNNVSSSNRTEKKKHIQLSNKVVKKTKIPNGMLLFQMREEALKIKNLLRSIEIGSSEYSSSKITTEKDPFIRLTFNDKILLNKSNQLLSKKYKYEVIVEKLTLVVSLSKNRFVNPIHPSTILPEKKSIVSKIENKTKTLQTDDLEHFQKVKQSTLKKEADTLNDLREKAKRIIDLVRSKFNLKPERNGSGDFKTSRIRSIQTKGLMLQFKTEDRVSKVFNFLESQNYKVHRNDHTRELTVDLLTSPEELENKKSTENLEKQVSLNLTDQLSEVIKNARTMHLSSEQIANRIFDTLEKNNMIIINKLTKVSLEEISNGKWLNDIDRDFFNIIVQESLK